MNIDLFREARRKKIKELLEKIDRKDLVKRYCLLIVGCFIVAFAFNIFFKQYGIVCFGISGLSLVANKFGISNFMFILVGDIILLFISHFTLGKKKTKDATFGSILFPIFVWLTQYLVPYFQFENLELLVAAIFGGVLSGIGYGLIYKTNFNTGGTDIVCEIVAKYTKVSLGKAMWVSDGLVVMSGLIVASPEMLLYGFLVLYLISFMTDRVMLGISQSKAFYVVTEKKDEVRDFLLSMPSGGVTLINAKGGYSNQKETLLLGVVPTRQYFLVKEGLKEIDEHIFFLACDAYEVSTRRK